MSHFDSHLDAGRIQEFLDRALSSREEGAVRAHLDVCPRCREEVEAWRGIFRQLEDMPVLSPSPLLSDRVMQAVRTPEGAGILERLKALLRFPGSGEGHPDARILLEYLDRALPGTRRAAVTAHLDACASCQEELVAWRVLTTRLDGLRRMEPPVGFADAVMARVRIPEPTRAPSMVDRARGAAAWIGGSVGGWAGTLRPRTRKAWAVASVPVVAPLVAVLVGAVALFSSHPLLTPTSLASFLTWQVTGAFQGLVTAAGQAVLGSPLLLEGWRLAQDTLADPTVLGAGAVAFSAATAAALWILYRNLAPAGVVDRGYANAA